jgi:hypothetical protein
MAGGDGDMERQLCHNRPILLINDAALPPTAKAGVRRSVRRGRQ